MAKPMKTSTSLLLYHFTPLKEPGIIIKIKQLILKLTTTKVLLLYTQY